MQEETTRLAIRRLLRCATTGRYLKGDGWTFHVEEATRFADQFLAIGTCIEKKLENVELVLLTPDAKVVFSSRIR